MTQHSPERLCTLNNFRFFPLNHIAAYVLAFTPPLVLGFSQHALLAYATLTLPIVLFQHSNIRYDFGRAELSVQHQRIAPLASFCCGQGRHKKSRAGFRDLGSSFRHIPSPSAKIRVEIHRPLRRKPQLPQGPSPAPPDHMALLQNLLRVTSRNARHIAMAFCARAR